MSTGTPCRIVISDIHMNDDRADAGNYGWLTKPQRVSIEQFLQFLVQDSYEVPVKEVVLLGDIVDNWECPVDISPPSFQAILDSKVNRGIVAALADLCTKTSVIYVPGNHDMGIDPALLTTQFPGIKICASADNNAVFRAGRTRAEHAHAHGVFCCNDDKGYESWIPLGYFMSRVTSAYYKRTGKELEISDCLDQIQDLFHPGGMAANLFGIIVEKAGLTLSTDVLMPNGAKIPLGEVKDKYSDRCSRWATEHNDPLCVSGFMAEVKLLGGIADKLCEQGGTNVVVFGHSHKPALDKDKFLCDDRIYVNSGSWCDADSTRTAHPNTFVDLRKEATEVTVRLCQWADGAANLMKSEFVPR